MVRPLVWVLGGLAAYTVVAMALRARGLLPPSVRVQGPITTLHTKRGRALLDWLARPKRFWRAWGNFGLGVALVVMVGSFLAVLTTAYNVVSRPTASPVTEPQNVLVIPGVNEFLPLSAAPEIVFGLLVGLVVHEGGHGLLCRVEDIDIESMGLAFITVIPVGAFVEPDEESRDRADRGSQTRMFAAGVTNNFAITLVAFLLLFGPIMGSVAVVGGAPIGGVLPGSAAEDAGIERGDVITAVDGESVTSADHLDAVLANTSARSVRTTLKGGETVTVERSLIVTRALADGPTGIDLRTTITAVNGTRVYTERRFERALSNSTIVTVRTADGSEATFPAGAYVARVTADGPLSAAGAPAGASMIVTRVDGERTVTDEGLREALAGTRAGQEVTVTAFVDGDRKRYEVTLGENPRAGDRGLLGVILQRGVSGLVVDDFGIDAYPAEQFLGLLGGGTPERGVAAASFFRRMGVVLFLPFASAVEPSLSYNFAGFVGFVTNFYEVTGPLGALGGWVFTLANATFWTGWINLQLGFFNAIPAFPLDGGHILRTSTEAVVSRLPIGRGRRVTSVVTTAISLVMLAGLVLMVFGPQLLG